MFNNVLKHIVKIHHFKSICLIFFWINYTFSIHFLLSISLLLAKKSMFTFSELLLRWKLILSVRHYLFNFFSLGGLAWILLCCEILSNGVILISRSLKLNDLYLSLKGEIFLADPKLLCWLVLFLHIFPCLLERTTCVEL